MSPLVLASALALAAPAGSPASPAAAGDPQVESLVREALENRPEVRQARAQVEAENARVPQAGALPDPTLTLGIQNDGFREIQIGKMETSYWQVMASQSFPWFGKRGLREEAAGLQARQAEAALARVRLSVEADVRRAWLDLLLVRDELSLLGKLEALWRQSEGLARARYESGEGPQSDLLRAQLERSRLRQRRFALEAGERARLQALNRLLARPLEGPIPTSRSLSDLPDPPLPDAAAARADAEARSPELERARLATAQAERRVALARRDYFPDFTISAGIMPRGSLDPMWQAALSFNLPIFAGSRQSRAVAEGEARGQAEAQGAEAVRQVLRERVEERLALLSAVLEANGLYRSGLLVQSEATAESTLAQYRVGRVTFASVLEALAGYVSDFDGFLQSVAEAQRLAIAQQEVSLDPAPGLGAAGIGGGGMPGAGATGGGASGGMGSTSPPAETGGATSMSRM